MFIALTSGVALGTHVPGLLVDQAFTARGLRSRVYVLEDLFPAEARQSLRVAKARYSRDYRLAKAAHALATDHADLISAEALATLYEEWDEAGVRGITVFSGFWTPVVQAYVGSRAHVRVEVCHVDAAPAPSHRRAASIPRSTHAWMLDARTNTLNELIPVSADAACLPWAARSIGFLAHGGGWGMGTHAAAAARLAEAGESVSLIRPETVPAEDSGTAPSAAGPADAASAGISVYTQDPTWQPGSDTGFPRLTGLPPGRARPWSDAFELTRASRAVVSKPGAGTLIDSLNAATPVLFTDALGDWERANESVWCALGFGMSWSTWMDKRDPAQLEAMHERLRAARESLPSYPERLIDQGFGQ